MLIHTYIHTLLARPHGAFQRHGWRRSNVSSGMHLTKWLWCTLVSMVARRQHWQRATGVLDEILSIWRHVLSKLRKLHSKKKTVQDNKTEPIRSDELAMKLSSQLCDFLAPGRFKLTQWFSNSHKVSSLYQVQKELYKLIFWKSPWWSIEHIIRSVWI